MPEHTRIGTEVQEPETRGGENHQDSQLRVAEAIHAAGSQSHSFGKDEFTLCENRM